MLSHENRVILGSIILLVLAVLGAVVVDTYLGISLGANPVLSFLVFAGIVVVAPQLYLATTDEDVSPRSRVRFAVIATGVFAAMFAGNAEGLESRIILTIAGGAFVGLVCYEFFAGYRSSSNESPPQPQ
ncbi:hypothetical protein [Natronorubrum halophilum]|uniref:hypothetical protein n=1 Tax=Natronorubrum halophilum TaxID=1702106 RepID=UPI0010C2288F|nr:hypothetical protein [Natronorubrum halophilum]